MKGCGTRPGLSDLAGIMKGWLRFHGGIWSAGRQNWPGFARCWMRRRQAGLWWLWSAATPASARPACSPSWPSRRGSRGFTVLSGRCAELADTVPYLPLADALRDAAGPAAGPLRDALATRPVLARLLPDREITRPPAAICRAWRSSSCSARFSACSPSWPRPARCCSCWRTCTGPTGSTRDLVTFLSRVLRGERIALAVSYRTDDMHRSHPLRPVVGELLRLPSVTAIERRPARPAGDGRAPDAAAPAASWTRRLWTA